MPGIIMLDQKWRNYYATPQVLYFGAMPHATLIFDIYYETFSSEAHFALSNVVLK